MALPRLQPNRLTRLTGFKRCPSATASSTLWTGVRSECFSSAVKGLVSEELWIPLSRGGQNRCRTLSYIIQPGWFSLLTHTTFTQPCSPPPPKRVGRGKLGQGDRRTCRCLGTLSIDTLASRQSQASNAARQQTTEPYIAEPPSWPARREDGWDRQAYMLMVGSSGQDWKEKRVGRCGAPIFTVFLGVFKRFI